MGCGYQLKPMAFGMSQDQINSIQWGGLPSVNEEKAAKAEKMKRESVLATREVRDAVNRLAKTVGQLEGRVQQIETMLVQSVRIQEKIFLAQMATVPVEKRPVQLPDAEIKARQIMEFSVFDELTAEKVKQRFKALAKKRHPDVKGVESDVDFILLENAYQLLLSSVCS